METSNTVESTFKGSDFLPHEFALKIAEENRDKYVLVCWLNVDGYIAGTISIHIFHKDISNELIEKIQQVAGDIGFFYFDDDNMLNAHVVDSSPMPSFEIINLDEKLMLEISKMKDFSKHYTRRNRRKRISPLRI